MSTPTERNRLDEEASPYLRQHADNPVAWQPWDEDALAAARERDVPIFLSVGYAACHWCHVMEEESFVDDAVAERLNEDFVPIKVDREERPDLDSVYQTACQLVSGRGGWPLSVFCTPDGEPFHVGTYFPREPTRGMPGFLDILEGVAESWADPEERQELASRADELTGRVRAHLESVPESADEAEADASAIVGSPDAGGAGGEASGADSDAGGAGNGAGTPTQPGESDTEQAEPGPVERAAAAALQNADREYGGWGSGPKFPQPVRVEALLEAARSGTPTASAAEHSEEAAEAADAEGEQYESAAVAACAAMVDGGLYDHVGGGFHRYCTDREWVVPHFEKMLYDNAEIPRVLLAAHQVTGRERFETIVTETVAFLDRELAQRDGSLASTLDARSPVPPHRTEDGEPGEDEEGAFYVWTPEEVATALEGFDGAALLAEVHAAGDDGSGAGEASADAADVDLVDIVCERYGVTEPGNFEGQTVLTVDASFQELASEHDLEPATVQVLLDGAREALREHREQRPRPRRDDKVIGAWNGLAIRALAEGATVLRDDGLALRARDALDAVRETLWDGERLARRYVLAESDTASAADTAAGADGDTATGADADTAAGADGDDAGAADDAASESGDADVQGEGYLEDYAFLGRGALACYEARADVDALAFALDLADAIVDQFYDADDGTLYVTPAEGESLIARPQEPMDQSTPSSLGVGADLLAALDAFVPHDRFGAAAEDVVRTHAQSIERQPLQHPSLALAAERVRSGSTEVTLAAEGLEADDRAAELVAEWRDWLADTYLPRRLLAPRPATDAALEDWLDELGLDEAPPIWAGRDADVEPTAYVCQGFTCSRPLHDPADAAEWLEL